jgi:signal transduction histidine kinase
MERSDEPESVQRSARMRRSREQGAPAGGTTTASRLRTSEELIRQLAARLETAREDERRVLARELHDELGQTLTAIKLELARIITLFKQDRIYPGGIDRLQALVGLAEIGMATVKRLTTDLRLAALDHVELSAAVRWEAIAFHARTGLQCHVTVHKGRTSLTHEQQTGVFRIFQEALTNVARHARATAVRINLVQRRGMFELRVHDDGRGITKAQMHAPGALGLLGMQERASLIGGTFEIARHRTKGTIVTVKVPLAARATSRNLSSRGRARSSGPRLTRR